MEALAIPRPGITAFTKSASSAWDLLVAVTARDIKVRYQGTVLSYIWWIARPLALGAVLFFALGQVLRLGIPNYSVFLLSALFPWQWFSGSVTQAAGSFSSNGGLLKKVRFPRIILPLSSVLFNTTQFLMTLPVLVIFIVVQGLDMHVEWLAGVPILLIVQVLLIIGLGTILGSLNVFFKDLSPLLEVGILMMFYITPIIYPIERVPAKFEWLMKINPMAPLIEAWRELFLYGTMPGPDLWPALVLMAGSLVLGLVIFRKVEGHFADAL